MKKYIKGIIFLGALLLPVLALADVTVNFNNSGVATTTPGTAVVISGTITNNSSSTAVSLNSLSNLFLSPFGNGAMVGGYSVDYNSSFGNLPSTLAAGAVYQGPLVNINIGSTTTPGQYWGVYNLVGSDSVNGSSTLATQLFYVNVTGSTQSTSSISFYSSSTPNSSGLLMPSTESGLAFNSGLSAGANNSLSQYPNGPRLIKLNGDGTVYWVSENNLKIPMTSAKVFLSYNNKWSDVQIVEQTEFDYYQDAKFIWLNGKGAIYKINHGVKQYIPSSVWNPAGIDPNQIIWVNSTDFNSYSRGENITSQSDLQQ